MICQDSYRKQEAKTEGRGVNLHSYLSLSSFLALKNKNSDFFANQ